MLNKKLTLFICSIYIVAVICYIFGYKYFGIYNQYAIINNISLYKIILFIILAIIAESFLITYNHIGISTGFAVTVAAIICFGVIWGMIIASVGTTFRFYKNNNKINHIGNTPFYKTIFNISIISISIFFAGNVYYYFYNILNYNDPVEIFIIYALFIFTFLFVNTLIISILVTILSDSNFLSVANHHLKIGFLNIIFISPLGFILAYLYYRYLALGALLFIIPILLLRYLILLYTD